ncbi:hypothetical protein [Kribbella sp. NPDC051770]|uniref:hypothetical protein n=1 Tax=Kribbella sp. NPDC051770 TaxID=3155413 RepID=UPI003436B578
MLWARTRDAEVCRFAPNGMLVERAAGLTDGGYAEPDTPSPTAVRVFVVLVLAGLVIFERHRLGRQLKLVKAHFDYQKTAAATFQGHRQLRQAGCRSCGDL